MQAEALKIRHELLRYMAAAVQRSDEDRRLLLDTLRLEMADDPMWVEMYGSNPIDFKTWRGYMSDPLRYATHTFIGTFTTVYAIDIEIWQSPDEEPIQQSYPILFHSLQATFQFPVSI